MDEMIKFVWMFRLIDIAIGGGIAIAIIATIIVVKIFKDIFNKHDKGF